MKIAIIIPAYNEAASIYDTIKEYQSVFPRASVVAIDNNSTDNTHQEIERALRRDQDVVVTELKQGKGYAVSAGLSRVDADAYIMIDGDLTYPAEDARRCLELLIQGRHDIVIGDRLSTGSYHAQNHRLGHSSGNYVLTKLISFIANYRFKDVESGMRVMSRPFVRMVALRSKGFQLEPELTLYGAHIEADIRELPISYRARMDGSESKLDTIKDGIRIVRYVFSEWIYYRPFQALSIMFVISAMISGLALYRPGYDLLKYGELTAPYVGSYMVGGLFATFCGISAVVGMIMQSVISSSKRRDIALFKEQRRHWNAKLDASLKSKKSRKSSSHDESTREF